jgi:rubrerythrin
MKREELEKILENYKEGKIVRWKAVNEILLLSVVIKNEVSICPICEETVLLDGNCPKCTVELCSPPRRANCFITVVLCVRFCL